MKTWAVEVRAPHTFNLDTRWKCKFFNTNKLKLYKLFIRRAENEKLCSFHYYILAINYGYDKEVSTFVICKKRGLSFTITLALMFIVHKSHICDTAWIGHPHSNVHVP
jgi:hypothetical protein